MAQYILVDEGCSISWNTIGSRTENVEEIECWITKPFLLLAFGFVLIVAYRLVGAAIATA